MRHFEELTNIEIAESLGITEQAAATTQRGECGYTAANDGRGKPHRRVVI